MFLVYHLKETSKFNDDDDDDSYRIESIIYFTKTNQGRERESKNKETGD